MQTRTITSTLVTTYTYDAANRLATQNGQSIFAWDANGNLLADGSTVYAYDFENRLISTTLSGVNTQFGYNGDGIRLRLIEAGTLTTYTQDYAAPLPVVLQAKTGSASTQYVYSLGTRPLAEYEAAAWEYLLADPLGSVRQIADSGGNVTLLKSYEPYGSVLNSQGTATSIFGFSGEQIDSTGLIYLRARYMQPRLGMFLSRDPWEGDVLRPGSMNGWGYVDGNPVNSTDPSGRLPKWSEVGKWENGGYEYSCNCGWIDWTHASPGIARSIIQKINSVQGLSTSDLRYYGGNSRMAFAGNFEIRETGGGGVEGTIVVNIDMGRNSRQVFEVSLGVYRDLQNLFERYQGGNPFWARGAIDDIRFFHSSYSEEDMMSNLIGFYIAVGMERDAGLEVDLKKEFRVKCGVVGVDDDPVTYLIKQRNAYTISQLEGFEDVFDWYSPRYHCIEGCENDPQRIPSELLEYYPIPPSLPGLWMWYSASAQWLNLRHDYDRQELNRWE